MAYYLKEQWLWAIKASMEFHSEKKTQRYRLVLKALSMIRRGIPLDEKIKTDIAQKIANEKVGIHTEFTNRCFGSGGS